MVSRVAWGILAPFCVVLAVLAVVVIVRDNTKSDDAKAATAATTLTVKMADIAFAPKTLTVPSGAEVTFDNKDVAPHTVTADDGSSDSGTIQPGKAYQLTVDKAFTYHCTIHPSMKAEIRLEG